MVLLQTEIATLLNYLASLYLVKPTSFDVFHRRGLRLRSSLQREDKHSQESEKQDNLVHFDADCWCKDLKFFCCCFILISSTIKNLFLFLVEVVVIQKDKFLLLIYEINKNFYWFITLSLNAYIPLWRKVKIECEGNLKSHNL